MLLLAGLPSIWLAAQAPAAVTLQECLKAAEARFPQNQQKELLRRSFDLADKNLAIAFLPQMDLSAQASWQSAVTKLPIELPNLNIPTVPKDQYKATLNVNQMVYDGGRTRAVRDMKATELVADQQQVDVDLFQVREKVNDVFFGILMVAENLDQVGVMKKELNEKLKQVQAGIANGAILPGTATTLEAELLKLEQKEMSLNSSRTALLAILSEWTGQEIGLQTQLQVTRPADFTFSRDLGARPEQKLFRARMAQIDASDAILKAGRRPTVGLYAQGGYGRPGLNFLDNSFQPWAIMGIRANWNIWDWNKSRNERQIMDLNKEMVRVRKETFEFTTRLQLISLEEGIKNLENLIEKDKELIALRTKIKNTASKQLDLGALTATEYLTELNSEQIAQLALRQHELELQQKRAQYIIIQGL